jgi:hypothetical protein
MMTGTLSLRATVWNELECFLPTIIVPDILICVCRNQSNLDLAECETELVDTIRKFENLFICCANMFISTILAVLFFGGYNYLEWLGRRTKLPMY